MTHTLPISPNGRRLASATAANKLQLWDLVYPLVNALIRRKLNVTSETAIQAHEQIRQIFDTVGSLLADGRPYLVGDRFSAADLTFAALWVAAVRPPEYGDAALALSNLEQLPPKMAAEVCAFRAMPAGAFALRLWRDRGVRQRPCLS